MELPDLSINPNAQAKPGLIRVERTVISVDGELAYDSPEDEGFPSPRAVDHQTTALLRDYLASHPRRNDPNAPLFCAVTLKPSKPTGKPATDSDGNRVAENAAERKLRQATALASLSVDEAASRLELDWSSPLAHQTFYQAVFRPAVLRANRRNPRSSRRTSPFMPFGTPTRVCVSPPESHRCNCAGSWATPR